jgi:putative tricarboxylic transport membrane protein
MQRGLVTGVAALVIGIGYLAMGFQLRASALADAVGPAGLPKVLGFVMVTLGLIQCLQAVLAGRMPSPNVPVTATTNGADEIEPVDEGSVGWAGLARAGGLLAIAVGYLLVIKVIGYPLAVATLLIAVSIYGGAKVTWRVFAIGIAGAVVYWVLFVEILGIPLPTGILASIL